MNGKKIAAAVLTVFCIAGSGLYATFSYMHTSAGVTNEMNFSGPDGLCGVLTEPAWEPQRGILLVPNMTIPKDPQITNTSKLDMDALAAMKVEFVYTDTCPQVEKRGKLLSQEDMAYVMDVFSIDYNADKQGDWARFEGETQQDVIQHFYYCDVLERNYPEQGDTTIPLFTKLTIEKTVNNQRFLHVQEIGGFDIRLSGQLIQQMDGEYYFGLDNAQSAYQAGLFDFQPQL